MRIKRREKKITSELGNYHNLPLEQKIFDPLNIGLFWPSHDIEITMISSEALPLALYFFQSFHWYENNMKYLCSFLLWAYVTSQLFLRIRIIFSLQGLSVFMDINSFICIKEVIIFVDFDVFIYANRQTCFLTLPLNRGLLCNLVLQLTLAIHFSTGYLV